MTLAPLRRRYKIHQNLVQINLVFKTLLGFDKHRHMNIALNKYKFLIFDVDETLLDFRKSEHWAFHQTLLSHGITENHAQLFKSYRQISTQLWDQLEKNLISKDKLKVHRYELLLDEHSLTEHNPESLSEEYLNNLQKKVFLIDNALDICQHLSQMHTLGIITNGIESVQRSRMSSSGLNPYFNNIVVSEQCGFAKPDPRIFDFTLKLNGFSAEESLMIGDKLEADILGAKNVNMDSCWLNLHGTHKNTTNIQPTYEITDLRQLRQI